MVRIECIVASERPCQILINSFAIVSLYNVPATACLFVFYPDVHPAVDFEKSQSLLQSRNSASSIHSYALLHQKLTEELLLIKEARDCKLYPSTVFPSTCSIRHPSQMEAVFKTSHAQNNYLTQHLFARSLAPLENF